MAPRSHDEFLAATLPALDLVYNLARRLVDASQVEDLVQETYLKAYGAWLDARRPRNAKAWMATICLNTGRSWLRRVSARAEWSVADPPHIPAPFDIEEEALRAVSRDRVHEALWKLPEAQRVAIVLMDLGGFTAAETAKITGSPRGTVLARVHRGRKRLLQVLAPEVVDREP
jgi:RNA polymerase sigma-70 factor (ECF subfamily)